MLQKSLDKIVNVEIPIGATTGKATVNLPQGVLVGLAAYDDKDATPKFLQLEIEQNGNQVIEGRHLDAFRRQADNKAREVVMACSGTYDVKVWHDDVAQVAAHKVQVEFIILSESEFQLLKG